MSKLIMMRGLPASGKSTKAKELMEKSGNFVRVNKDLLREMLHFNKFNWINEMKTTAMEVSMIERLLVAGVYVIVDNTNLGKKHEDTYRNIVNKTNSKLEIIEMDTPVKDCLIRDVSRDKKVGSDVIVNMALQYKKMDLSKGLIICDIDGTLADITHRLHFVKQEKKDWKNFFASMGEDTPRKEIIGYLSDMQKKYDCEIVLVSGRPDDWKALTEKWLRKNEIYYTSLIMRGARDTRDDTIVKQEIYDKYFKHYKENIIEVIDDRPRVIKMWESNGLKVKDVGRGIDF